MKRTLDFTEGSEELPPAKVPCQRDLYSDSVASSSSSFPSSFSNSSTSQWKYDVFLSFRGEDTRNTLVDFVNYALQRRGIYIFKDDEKLEGGKAIKPELLKAIEESRFAVVVLSENYASSTWCLEELVKIIDCVKEKRMTVLPIFYNVDPSDVRKQTGTFAKAFDEHEKQFKEKVGTWRDALNHVAGIVGHHHVKNSPLSEAVKWIVGRLSHISSFEFSQITEGLVGIDSRLVELESCLALKDDVRFIGIWAMGGMGKSTLARVVYQLISKEFDASCLICQVREKDELSLQKDLISQILLETIFIKNKYDGADMIKKILWNRKVLLVLDDVDDSKKLKMLVRKSDRFGSGSRIIITTRDMHLLKEFPVDETFEVKALNYEDAHCLFCSQAFKKEKCPDEYLEVSKSFLKYVNGLPLALEVLGSFLFGKSAAEWKCALEMLKKGPDCGINSVLKISFDGLPYLVQDIFIDIACFFNHEERDKVVGMLDSIDRHSVIGLCILIDKSLLKISKNNELWMHDLLREMGRDIVRQESRDEPGKRSRLWLFEDIDQVLKNDEGTEKVQAMDIREAKDTSISYEENDERWLGFRPSNKPSFWNPNAFSKMPNLKFLRVHDICPEFVPVYLPNKLSYLEWSYYPSKSLPCPNELVQLRLQCSKIELLWGGTKNFDKLKFIDMVGSLDLITTPNVDGVPNLKKLVLASCSNLCELHPSIVKLKKLEFLDLEGCQELVSLPDKFEMESLVNLNLSYCSKVKKIPEFAGNMKLLQQLHLKSTAITALPSSIECLTGLNILTLRNCKQLAGLPNTICSLTSLNSLDLFGCSKVDKLPEDLGNIVWLEYLWLGETAIKVLPSSFVERLFFFESTEELRLQIGFLGGLTLLDLTNCKDFVLLPSTICSVKSLSRIRLSGCSNFVNLPENLGNLEGLTSLCLEGTAIELLPSSVGRLTTLWQLNLRDCKNLVCLPGSICGLKKLANLDLSGCSKFVNLPESICSLKKLAILDLSGCSEFVNLPENLGNLEVLYDLSLKGTAIEVLPSSVGRLTALKSLDIRDCKNLVCLPDNIGCLFSLSKLLLCGSNFISLPESISQLSRITSLDLDGCKRLRSVPDIPSEVLYINVNNCTSLERFPECPKNCPFWCGHLNFNVQCINCFNIQINNNVPKGLFLGPGDTLGMRFSSIFPGQEIPNGFEKLNIHYSSVLASPSIHSYSVNIQLPVLGFYDLWAIILCVVFVPCEHYNHHLGIDILAKVDGQAYTRLGEMRPDLKYGNGKFESHHLWLCRPFSQSIIFESDHLWLSRPQSEFGYSGIYLEVTEFNEVQLIIDSRSVEVETVGFRFLDCYNSDYEDDWTWS